MKKKTPAMKCATTAREQAKETLIRELRESVERVSARIRKSERLTAADLAVQINVSQ
jgi:hypothetical protein